MGRLDLESGLVSANPGNDRQWDLLFGCWPDNYESLRTLSGVSWVELGLVDFENIGYRNIRDANFNTSINSNTGYSDIYFAHRSNVPGEGYVFLIKTPEGNVGKLQIVGYENDANPQAARRMKIRYKLYPVVPDSSKPFPPDC